MVTVLKRKKHIVEARSETHSDGFSLLELMVVVALFTIITGTALFVHARFGESIITTNLAYDIALAFREAQNYGISARETAPSSGAFTFPYGVHFGLWSGNQAVESDRTTSFVSFTDRNGDDRYNGTDFQNVCNTSNPQSECLTVFRLERGNVVQSFCGVVSASGASECGDPTTSAGDISYLDVSFHRPEPDAFIQTNLNASGVPRYRSARITIASPRGTERRTIEVYQTGQISITTINNP